MIQSTAIGTFTPASRDDFGARARFLSKLLKQPYQRCQESLAKLYGYGDLHQLQAAIRRAEADPALKGPYDEEWSPLNQDTPQINLAGRSNETLAVACALCDVSLAEANPRIWDAQELGLFNSLPKLRVQAKNILRKHDLLDKARDPSPPPPESYHEVSDYGQIYMNAFGEAMVAFTPLGRSVFHAIEDIEHDENAEPEDTYSRLKIIADLHPNNPWALTAVAAHAGQHSGQAPWTWYIDAPVDNGSGPPNIDLIKATQFLGEETLIEARRAIDIFEELYGPADETTNAPTELMGSPSSHSTDTKGFVKALYWAGMAASNDRRRNRSRQAAGWLSRSAKFKKDPDLLTRLAILSFYRGDKRPQRHLEGFEAAPSYLIQLTVALRDLDWEDTSSALEELLTCSSQFVRCIDDSFRECDRYYARTHRHTRLDLDEILWRLGYSTPFDPPHYVKLLRNILADEKLRKAYVACWKAEKEAFGCALKEPVEYHRLASNRDDSRSALKAAVRDAVDHVANS